ncbi:MAG: hypothetical protein AAGB04_03275 [Pseudomonadota bacterium]
MCSSTIWISPTLPLKVSIREARAHFVELCSRIETLAHAWVAIDGPKFEAVNNRDRNFTESKMKRRMAQIDGSVGAICVNFGAPIGRGRSNGRAMKIQAKREDRHAAGRDGVSRRDQQIASSAPDQQISFTDPRSMATRGRKSSVVGYKVQVAVDTKDYWIVVY